MRTREEVETIIRLLTARIGRRNMKPPPNWVFEALARAEAELDAIKQKESEG